MIVLDGFKPIFISFLPCFIVFTIIFTMSPLNFTYLLHCIPECYSLATSPVVTVGDPRLLWAGDVLCAAASIYIEYCG